MVFSLFKSLFLTFGTVGHAAGREKRSDEELMFAYQGGDLAAFETLVKRHEKPLFNFILRSVRRTELAEELLQEAFMRIIRSAASYQEKAKFTTWAYTIARNLCIDRARKTKNRHEMSLNTSAKGDDGGLTYQDRVADDSAKASSGDYERKVFLKRLQDALDELPEEQREIFVMRQVSGLKFREISDILECPLPTVKSRMRYAIEALRSTMASYKGHSFDNHDQEEVRRV